MAPRVGPAHYKCMCDYFDNAQGMAVGRMSGDDAHSRLRRNWDLLARQLNAINPLIQKSGKDWETVIRTLIIF